MKRQLIFEIDNEKYVLKENGEIIFGIDGKELKFNSLDFYNGVYKNNSSAIELTNEIREDELKKGNYIFLWLNDIVEAIHQALGDPELDEHPREDISQTPTKIIYLFEMAACAGDGFYNDGEITSDSTFTTTNLAADYAVRISGKSMEPTIEDNSIVCVQKNVELIDGDIGIFVVDGEVMCKRYREENGECWLQPENDSGAYKSIHFSEDSRCYTQGKVLLQ